METKANFVMIGAASIVGVILIMMFALWMANSEYSRGYNEFDVVFSDPVRGLAEGGEVRFNGIKVGEVTALNIDPDNNNRVIARVRISSNIPIKRDSIAQLEPIGITGVTLIQLNAGSANEPPLRSGGFNGVPRIQGRGSQIDLIFEQGQSIAMRASEAMAQVRDLLTDENIEKVSGILRNLNRISEELAAERSVINQSADTAAALTRAANSISDLSDQTKTQLTDLGEILDNVGDASRTASGQTLPDVTAAAEDIRRAADNLNRLAASVERNNPVGPRPQRQTVEIDP